MVWKSDSSQVDISIFDKDKIITVQDQQISDWVIGDQQPKVTVIEYSDYQCPACAEQNSKIQDVIKRFPAKVALVMRHYPLPNNINAKAAAAAAEAAGLQGKFWQMNDKLFKTFTIWGSDAQGREKTFQGYATELGLDLQQFNQDITSDKVKQKIERDMALGKSHQLNATPTIIVNGEKIDPEVWADADKFAKLISSKL